MKPHFLVQFLMTVLIILLSNASSAIPVVESIEGNLSPGEVVYVFGINFGTAAVVLQWDNFENNTSGNLIPGSTPIIGAPWVSFFGETSELVRCTSESSYSGENAARLWVESPTPIGFGEFLGERRNEVYCSFRRFRPDVGPSGIQENIMRFWLGAFPFQHYSKLGYYPNQIYLGAAPGGPAEEPVAAWFQVENQFNTWNRWEVFYKTEDQFFIDWQVMVDGAIKFVFDQHLLGANEEGGDWAVNSLFLGGYMSGFDGAPFSVLFDDVYLAEGRARIEIGDKPDFDQCTWRDILLPLQWENGFIQFSIPSHGLPISDEYFLFVVDDNGDPSMGTNLPVSVTEKPMGSVKALFR